MFIDWRILASVLAWKTQKSLPLGSISERLPIEWAQQGLIYTSYSLLLLLRVYFIYESMDSLQSQEEVKHNFTE